MNGPSRRRQQSLVALVALVPAILLAACEPTGSPRCDSVAWGAQAHIFLNGWTLDCDPPFDGYSEGQNRTVAGWADAKTRTVYVWPEHNRTDAILRKTITHEAGHTYGYGEWLSDVFAWCHLAPHERDGLAFLAPYPTQNDCHRVAS